MCRNRFRQETRWNGFRGSSFSCSKANGWTEEIKTAKLPTLLEGEALATRLELDEEERKEYEKVNEKMVEILMPTGFVTFDQFHQRTGIENHCLCSSTT